MSIDDQVAQRLTDARLADDIEHLASNVRWLAPTERAARLREAARRLANKTTLPAEQVLVTLVDGRQVGIMYGNVQVRSSVAGTWSLPIEQATTPHSPGTYYLGEW